MQLNFQFCVQNASNVNVKQQTERWYGSRWVELRCVQTNGQANEKTDVTWRIIVLICVCGCVYT